PIAPDARELFHLAVIEAHGDQLEGRQERCALLEHQPLAVGAPARIPRPCAVPQVNERALLAAFQLQNSQLTFSLAAAYVSQLPPVRREGRLALPSVTFEEASGRLPIERLLPQVAAGHENESATVW